MPDNTITTPNNRNTLALIPPAAGSSKTEESNLFLARNRLDSSVLELPAAGGISARVFRLLGVVIVLSGILACSILVICKGNKR